MNTAPTASVVTGRERLSPEDLEELHIRIATAASLGDQNINSEAFISDIVAARHNPVPQYSTSATDDDEAIRQGIVANDPKVWQSIFKAIKLGQIDAVDHFIRLGLDINLPHPMWKQYPLYYAVRSSQTNMMRHLINLGADVNSLSCIPRYEWTGFSGTIIHPDLETTRTPLMAAAEMGNLNICKILCETAFADPMLVGVDGQTAQRLAAENGHKEIVEYLPANRGGTFLRLKYDYHHRWKYIRKAVNGIYWFFRGLLYEVPRALLYELPKALLLFLKEEVIEIYKAIPPVKEWPRIFYRNMVELGKALKDLGLTAAKIIKETPRAIYESTKFLLKQLWKGIKAIPRLITSIAKALWSGIKSVAGWLRDLVLSVASFLHTLIFAIIDFFRSITLKDVLNGIEIVFRSIFIEFPKLVWRGLEAVVIGIHKILSRTFGILYWIGYYTLYALGWIATYVPRELWNIVKSIGGGIGKAFKEVWIWISPKSMI